MRVLYYIPHRFTTGADHWIYEGWKHAFRDLGHHFEELSVADRDWWRKVEETAPDLLFITNFVDLVRHRDFLLWVRKRGTKVMLVVDWPMRTEWVDIIRNEDVADVFFGEREPESMTEFAERTKRTYHLIPNAANSLLHFPTAPTRKYQYDIVYLGAYLTRKRRMFDDILLPLALRYKVGIFGPYWTARDYAMGALQRAARTVGAARMVDAINRLRVVIPPDEENQLYSSAKICLNFHEREEDGGQPHYIVNQRAFKIPACGGFEMCDYVPALSKYFSADEIVMATDPEDWFEKIDYFMTREEDRRRIQQNGARRALRDHTYHNRIEELFKVIGGV